MASPRFTTLSAWLQWMETLHPSEIDLGLARVSEVAKKLGLLESKATVITVAGTNGKGSFIASLEALLSQQKKTVGAYTSPHLIHYNERIRLAGEDASDALICAAFAAIDEARENISLTYFEFGTLAALYIFSQQHLDYILLEVGLGGRLDAVNIIDPDYAVITSIALDHQQWLGNTREKIAGEKAGILRRNGKLVLAETDAPKTLLNAISELNVDAAQLGVDFDLQSSINGLVYTECDGEKIAIALSEQPSLPLPSIAAAIQIARAIGLEVNKNTLQNALEGLGLAGRFQSYRHHKQTILLDVAHNPAAAIHLSQKLKETSKTDLAAIVAIMADKDIAHVLQPLVDLVKHWFCCDLPDNARAASAEDLRQVLLGLGVPSEAITLCANPNNALAESTQYNSDHSLEDVLVFGSFFTVESVLTKIGETSSG